MPKGTLAIKRQLKSIANTKKITKAMELVSASKMRRAVGAVLSARPYAQAANEIMTKVAGNDNERENTFFVQRPVSKKAIIVISSNRGLCGGFNNNVVQKALSIAREEGVATDVIALGRKGRDGLARNGYNAAFDFDKKDVTSSASDVVGLIKTAVAGYEKGEYDMVELVYTHFVSAMSQKTTIKQLLPITVEENTKLKSEHIFEPSKNEVLMKLIPRLLETQVFQAVLESEASEHSARMLAMRNANSSASDMFFDLQLAYNQARQAGITQEIAEISSGAAAMQ